MNTELKGKLEFISFFQPIKLFTENGEVDLRDYYFNLLKKLNGVKSKMDYTMNSISIHEDETSDKVVKYENEDDGILMILTQADGSFGMSNIGAYLPDMLQRLNGRQVIVSVEENGISITFDPNEEVYGLYYTRDNCCKIPDDKITSLCGANTTDCCIFLSAGSGGFECLKFDSSSARMLLDRYSKGEMRASRIGNCAIVGRKEDSL